MATASTLTPAARASQLLFRVCCTLGAWRDRASDGPLHVDAAAVATASRLTLIASKSALLCVSCTLGAVQDRTSDGLLHVDAAAVTTASTLTPAARASQPCFVYAAPSVHSRIGPATAPCMSTPPRCRPRRGWLLLRASQRSYLPCTGRDGVLHVDAAAVADASTPTSAARGVSFLIYLAPWVRSRVGPVTASCTSTPLRWWLRYCLTVYLAAIKLSTVLWSLASHLRCREGYGPPTRQCETEWG